ncbi:SgrR, sugar-phosphate stress, transcriptional activator of SgrS small RNA [Bacillus sp. JCM 19045]|nr:SgrR, sugar-phosphate stress, transcriptional activator of SgrS small RNA [Bacillus sp. JCM 19045]
MEAIELAQIETITLDSSSMLTFRLTKPNHLFLHLFTDKKSSILPVSSYRKQEAEFDRFPIGTGPFKITEHQTNYLKLEAFDRYFGYRPQLDQVELYRLPSGQLPIHNGIHYRVKQADTTETIIHDFPQTDRGGTYMVVNRQKPGCTRIKTFLRCSLMRLTARRFFQIILTIRFGSQMDFLSGTALHSDKRTGPTRHEHGLKKTVMLESALC